MLESENISVLSHEAQFEIYHNDTKIKLETIANYCYRVKRTIKSVQRITCLYA